MRDTDNACGASIESLLSFVRLVQKQRATRDAQCVFWIDGIRQFVQAFEGGLGFDTIIHSTVLLTNGLAEQRVRELASRGIRRVRVPPEQFRSVCLSKRASGIGAIVRQRWTPLRRASPYRGLCWLAVETLRSPGNLGTMLRTAE